MHCTSCGKAAKKENQKFCTDCGTALSGLTKKTGLESSTSKSAEGSSKSAWSLRQIISSIAILAFIGFGIISVFDEGAIDENDQGISSFNSGDSEQAISHFEQASDKATGNNTKVQSLINLGYVYASELQADKAVAVFKDALDSAEEESFEYYLLKGEIALLSGQADKALRNYHQAYSLSPDEFQINNALALFYLDIEGIAPEYVDYPRALEYAEKANEFVDPSVRNIARENLAIAHLFNENYYQTISLISESDTLREPYLAYYLGLAYLGLDDEKRARVYLQEADEAGLEMEPEIYQFLYAR